jgi:hypothetical protein
MNLNEIKDEKKEKFKNPKSFGCGLLLFIFFFISGIGLNKVSAFVSLEVLAALLIPLLIMLCITGVKKTMDSNLYCRDRKANSGYFT